MTYLDKINTYPQLTSDEEISLGNIIQHYLNNHPNELEYGDTAEYMRDKKSYDDTYLKSYQIAREKFILGNLKLVLAEATIWSHIYGIPLMDMMQDGTVGLIRSIDKFNPNRGVRFYSYSIYWIRQAFSEVVLENRLIYVPVRVGENLRKINKAMKKFRCEHNRDPIIAEIASAVNMDVKKVKEYLSIPSVILSEEYIPAHTLEIDDKIFKDQISKYVHKFFDRNISERSLSENNKQMFLDKFGVDGEPESLGEIGKKVGISRQRVHEILSNILSMLEKDVKEHEDISGI